MFLMIMTKQQFNLASKVTKSKIRRISEELIRAKKNPVEMQNVASHHTNLFASHAHFRITSQDFF